MAKESRTGSEEPGCLFRILALAFTSCARLGELLGLSLPQPLHVYKGDNSNLYLIKTLCGLNEIV